MKFTVERKTWLCGIGEMSRLLRNGERCCIGFCASQMGVRDAIMDCVPDLGKLPNSFEPIFKPVFGGLESEFLNEAYQINDSERITDDKRESQLAKLFATHGHEIVFVD